jgi:hypothetical protein
MPVNPWSDELYAESPIAVAEVFLSRAREALEACTDSEPIPNSYVALGQIVWDNCCGTLAALPDRTFRYVSFPQPITDHTNCDASLLAVDVILVLLRCIPIEEQNPVALSEHYTAISRDAALVYNAVTGELPKGWERANVEQDSTDGGGGCLAVVTTFTIGLPQSEWCVDCFEEP